MDVLVHKEEKNEEIVPCVARCTVGRARLYDDVWARARDKSENNLCYGVRKRELVLVRQWKTHEVTNQ